MSIAVFDITSTTHNFLYINVKDVQKIILKFLDKEDIPPIWKNKEKPLKLKLRIGKIEVITILDRNY